MIFLVFKLSITTDNKLRSILIVSEANVTEIRKIVRTILLLKNIYKSGNPHLHVSNLCANLSIFNFLMVVWESNFKDPTLGTVYKHRDWHSYVQTTWTDYHYWFSSTLANSAHVTITRCKVNRKILLLLFANQVKKWLSTPKNLI